MQSLYERTILALLAESKVDTFARSMTRDLIQVCRSAMDKVNKQGSIKVKYSQAWPSFLKRQDIFSTPVGRAARLKTLGVGSADPNEPTKFTVMLTINLASRLGEKDDIHMSGSWMPTHDTMAIQIVIVSTTGVMKPQHLSRVQEEAYDTFRHELEHSVQPDSKLVPAILANKELRSAGNSVWTKPSAFSRYLLSPAEKEAFVAGIYHKAKRLRKPFIKLLDDELEMLMRNATRKGLEATKVRNILAQVRYEWMQYAKERFPKAQLEQ